jgi:hypothetical protein
MLDDAAAAPRRDLAGALAVGTVGPMSDPHGTDGVDPSTVASTPVPRRSPTSEAVGRAMLGLGDIIDGKPPRDTYEIVVVVDESGEPEEPEDLVIEL